MVNTMTPYNDTEPKSGSFVRIFSEDVDEMELHWHRDRNDRTFTVEAGVGWKFQIDNYLPIDLVQGKSYFIGKDRYHRIWRGNDMLKIRITES